jgi:hypothetical protein
MESTPPSSILFEPGAICTLANEHALRDLELFLKTLSLWNEKPPPIYLYCTKLVADALPGFKYAGKIHTKQLLQPYEGLSRATMEKSESKKGYPNLFYDFTLEKCALLEWALKSLSTGNKQRGVLFCDADLVWLGPVPKIPAGKQLALSHHCIRKADELKYGIYNAGCLWTNDPEMPSKWLEESKTSRFFEQAALEDLVLQYKDNQLYKFGQEVNYGWWRMFQSDDTPQEKQVDWTIKRDPQQAHSGLLVQGVPLVCIHTHFKTEDYVTNLFNTYVKTKLQILKSQEKVKQILKWIG